MVQPRELVRLANGDTLRLTAGIVRRPFKGDTLTMFAFNGQHPGPLLQVAQDAEVTVELTNALDQPTTIHWHGIRLDNAFDGVPDLTQRAGRARRAVHLSAAVSRRWHLLVSPARARGHPARARALRQPDGSIAASRLLLARQSRGGR